MTKQMVCRCIAPLSLLATTTSVLGQQVLLEAAPEIPRNRFAFSYRMALNLDVNFKNIGGFGAQSSPGAAAGGLNHSYDDGFNNVDVTGNNHGPGFENTTWYWGYQNDSQYDSSGGGSISMNSTSSSGATSQGRNDDPHPGFEMVYGREFFRDEGWRWGMESAFGYNDVEIIDNSPLNVPVTVLTDVYQLNGVIPPSGPYTGTFGGPGPVISDTPSRSFSSSTASVIGQREFGADLFSFRFGPYVEIPVSPSVTLSFNTGVAMVHVHSVFEFAELVDTGGGPVGVGGKTMHSDLLFGGYFGGNVNLALNEEWTAFAGVLWQNVGSYTHQNGSTGQSAVLDMNNSLFVSVGLGFTF